MSFAYPSFFQNIDAPIDLHAKNAPHLWGGIIPDIIANF
jgi:hypothetical protein